MPRTRLEIIADILQSCLSPKTQTRMLIKCNLSSVQARDYLESLTLNNMLLRDYDKFKTTAKGHAFLSAYRQIERNLKIPSIPIQAELSATT